MTREQIGGVVMTPEQVSALSDTELNRAMIWLYAKNRLIDQEYKVGDTIGNLIWMREANYLSDWNLTMPLAVENSLCVEIYNTEVYPNDECWAYNVGDTIRSTSKNPLRAICEVLVLIVLDDIA